MSPSSVADQIAVKLAPHLGDFNAKIAVRTYAKKTFDISVEELTSAHVPELVEALRPMLNTLAGHAAAENLLRQIKQEIT